VPQLTQAQIEAQVAGLLHGVAILPDPTQARAACAAGGALPRSTSRHFVMYWEAAQLTQLPKDLADALATGKYRQASVGSCSPPGEEGAFTAYHIAVVLY
jgi:hypothetical protein